ncbi:MAG: ATPase [Dactylosporangium sp.]|nr:ATPase [Dactylosporangium sp.]
MSEFSSPDPGAVRPDGGRYGGSAAHQAQIEGGIRSRLLSISVLPAAVIALLCAATVVYVLAASADRVSTTTGAVLAVATAGCVIVLVVAARRAGSFARAMHQRIGALRSSTAEGRAEVQRLLEQLHSGERPALRGPEGPPARGSDIFTLLEHDLNQAQVAAQAAVVQASVLMPAGRPDQRVEVFVNLARRLQSLVHREIQLLDELENQVEDPDLLKGLFYVDHLATRIRRHAENLAVLGGAVSRRQWSRPVTLTEVLRSAIAEVEQYSRVKLVPPIEGTLRGHAVADVIHLVAELVENATMFSPPHTQVLLRAQNVTAGLAVEVEDRGLGMSLADQHRVNDLLTDPERTDIGELLRDGRIGLFVVSAIARRHGIAVRVQSNIYGGLQAVVILPQGLLGASPQDGESRQQTQLQQRPQTARPQLVPALPAHAPAKVPPWPPYPTAIPAEVAVPPFDHSNNPGQTTEPIRLESPQRPAAVPPASADSQAAHDDVRPQLPQRRGQTHLAPQLHQVPAPRREESVVGHDPNLMAAFMRGVGRAEVGADEEDGLRGLPTASATDLS